MRRVLLATALMAALFACKSNQSSQITPLREQDSLDSKRENEPFSYSQYQHICLDMAKNCELSDYRRIEDFAQKHNNQCRQNRIVYAAIHSKVVVCLDLIYLPAVPGNHIAYANLPCPAFDRNLAISRWNESLLSFKNILVRNATYDLDARPDDVSVIRNDLKHAQNRWDNHVTNYFKQMMGES